MSTASDETRSGWLDLTRVRDAFFVVVGLRVLYGAVLYFASLQDEGPSQPEGILEDHNLIWRVVIGPWLRRDAAYFHDIAAHGFSPTEGTTAFHPLYPFLSRAVGWMVGGPAVGLFVVSTLAAVALVVLISRYVAEFHDPELAQAAGWSALLLPGALVWFLPYTDALFTVFAIGSVWAMRERDWKKAGYYAMLATFTRQQGLFLGLPMLYCLWQAREDDDFRWSNALWTLLIPGAYLAVAGYRFAVLNDGFAADAGWWQQLHDVLLSSSSQEISPGQRIAFPWEPLIDHVSIFLSDTDQIHMLLDLVLGVSYAAALVAGWRRLAISERLFSLAVVAAALCYYNGVIAPYMALPRHVMIAFPLFVLAAFYLRDKDGRLYVAIGLAFNVVLCVLFGISKWIP